MPLETPKQRFVKDKHKVEAHRFLVSHAQMQDSLNQALLEYMRELAYSPSIGQQPAAGHFCASGAQRFIEIFTNLSEVAAPVARTQTANLDHTV